MPDIAGQVVILTVTDAGRSAAWYCDLLGAQETGRYVQPARWPSERRYLGAGEPIRPADRANASANSRRGRPWTSPNLPPHSRRMSSET